MHSVSYLPLHIFVFISKHLEQSFKSKHIMHSSQATIANKAFLLIFFLILQQYDGEKFALSIQYTLLFYQQLLFHQIF